MAQVIASESCPVVGSAMEGAMLRFRTQPNRHPEGKVLKCYWQVKIPDGPSHEELQYTVYINVTEAMLGGKYGMLAVSKVYRMIWCKRVRLRSRRF